MKLTVIYVRWEVLFFVLRDHLYLVNSCETTMWLALKIIIVTVDFIYIKKNWSVLSGSMFVIFSYLIENQPLDVEEVI